MKPRGPLMIEHRLIEKMLKLAEKELESIKKNKSVDPLFIDAIVDFIRTYADRTHHGKEEDILFKELENKILDAKDTKGMQELIDEHISARKAVKELVEAKTKFIHGDSSSIETIIDKLTFLTNFYPVHIEKEDKVFFPDTEKYFSDEELDNMLKEFLEFDRKMIHEKYNKLYQLLSENY
ncbi:hemerythrin domain-containing protein [candidate division WOR-3 bacterium]|nr:hemerythrin domain-containing protein [candidate division WOR-3 bacterium]